MGLLTYSLTAGFPVLFIAVVGVRIRNRIPNVLSFSDYTLRVRPSSQHTHVSEYWKAPVKPVALICMAIKP